MIAIIIRNILSQLIYFVGIVFLAGFLISLINRFFYRVVGNSRAVIYATGFLGTPIHELSHAVMCLVFFHKIDEIRFFQIDDENGVLGYVNHSHNPRNPYQTIGNYFIGVAPLALGGIAILLSMRYLIPDAYIEFSEYMDAFVLLSEDGFSLSWFAYAYAVFRGMLAALLSSAGEGIGFFVFAILALSVSLHMTLSGADIGGALRSLPLLGVALVAVNFILGLTTDSAYRNFVTVTNSIGGYLSCMLLIALVLSSAVGILALLLRPLGALLAKLPFVKK